MKCDDDIVKCLVFWTNLCLSLVGMSLISIGIIYKITLKELNDAIPVQYQGIIVVPVLIIPIGTVLIVNAVFGWYGCLTERINFVALHTVALFMIFVLQVTAGICSLFQLGDEKTFQEELNLDLKVLFKGYRDNYDKKEVVDLIQHRLKCCGFYGISDWDLMVPKSCYITDSKEIFENPCNMQVFHFLKNCMLIIGTSVISLSIIEIVGFVMSSLFLYYLMRRMRIRSKECECTKDHNFNYEDEL